MTINPIQQLILEKSLEKDGYVDTKDLLNEEMAELTFALNKYKRKPTESRLDDIHQEMADVFICLKKLELHFGAENIQNWIEFKINRLEERLNEISG